MLFVALGGAHQGVRYVYGLQAVRECLLESHHQGKHPLVLMRPSVRIGGLADAHRIKAIEKPSACS